MFTNKQSLIVSGVVGVGFFFLGLFGLLDYFIVKLILGSLFVLVILNLFLVKKETTEETNDLSSSNSEE